MSTLCQYPQHAARMADALAIVLDPTSRPQQRLLAWAALKTARGQKMSQIGLRRLQNDQERTRTRPPLILRMTDRIGGAA